jgi:uncharacterized protein (TIGR03435 family)
VRTAILFAGLMLSGFEVASVKPSGHLAGPDYGNKMSYSPTGFSAKNATLKRLTAEAYHVQPFQVMGAKWMDSAEYDLEARSGGPAGREELRAMLQSLLNERFHLALHREMKEMKVYNLSVDKNGPKLKPGGQDLDQFSALLAVQLTIHGMDDPTKPGMADGPPVPVINRTGLEGDYDFHVNIRPEPGADMFTLWQRALREELGLRLEGGKARVETLVIDAADKMPAAN